MALVRHAAVSAIEPGSITAQGIAIRALHRERALVEIAAADALCPGSDAVAHRGDPLGEVMLVKGLPGPAEAAGGAALSGRDGEAADKALTALGWNPAQAFSTLSSPRPDLSPERCAQRLRLLVEAVDPRVVVALDEQAGADLARAFGIEKLHAGRRSRVCGRRIVAVSGLEASLDDDARKQAVWSEFKAAAPEGPSY